MKAHARGNAFAMATFHGGQKIGTRRFYCCLLAVCCGVGLAVSGCGHHPPRDTNGNLPDDVARNFVEFVQAEDYRSAERLWYGESYRIDRLDDPKGAISDLRIDFEDFCAKFLPIDLATASISKARRGKSGFSIVNVDWEEDGTKKHAHFGLKIVDGEWKMERGYHW